VTTSICRFNQIGAKLSSALADALKVNASVTKIDLSGNGIDASDHSLVDELLARNEQFRRLFL
jgi:hypothetical protein